MQRFKPFLLPLLGGLALSSCIAITLPQAPAPPIRPVFERPTVPTAQVKQPFRTLTHKLAYWDGTGYQPLWIKGINLGSGPPGHDPGEMEISRAQYTRWFEMMHSMGFNTLRVYTLHRPAFFEALYHFNQAHPEDPLWLLQGIWLATEDYSSSLYDVTETYQSEIRDLVRAIHGGGQVGPVPGRANGYYAADVSPWVLGWIAGREVEPLEVRETIKQPFTPYKGRYYSLEKGNSAERWVVQQLDYLATHEMEQYQVQRPVSFSSWPTLDPLEHPNENDLVSNQDVAVLSYDQATVSEDAAGLFASYHIYPFYPDFMNDDPAYQDAHDAEGLNPYVGYLQALKAHYNQMPLLVAEYGLSSSWINARFTLSGMDHGGLTETEQFKGNRRLLQNIAESNLAGGCLFAWMDEWWKGTWIATSRSSPRERFKSWSNAFSAEEHFGLLRFDLPEPSFQTAYKGQDGPIQKLEYAADPRFFTLRLTLKPGSNKDMVIGYDTYRDDLGEHQLPGEYQSTTGTEFALSLKARKAQLQVTEAYDLFRYEESGILDSQKFQSIPSHSGAWNTLRLLSNVARTSNDGQITFPEEILDYGSLSWAFLRPPNSHDSIIETGDSLTVRIPWNYLHFEDPALKRVTHDDRSTDFRRETLVSSGIRLHVFKDQQVIETERLSWPFWEKLPPLTETPKDGVDQFLNYLNSLPEN